MPFSKSIKISQKITIWRYSSSYPGPSFYLFSDVKIYYWSLIYFKSIIKALFLIIDFYFTMDRFVSGFIIMAEKRLFSAKSMGAFKFDREPNFTHGDELLVVEQPIGTYEERLHVLTLGWMSSNRTLYRFHISKCFRWPNLRTCRSCDSHCYPRT